MVSKLSASMMISHSFVGTVACTSHVALDMAISSEISIDEQVIYEGSDDVPFNKFPIVFIKFSHEVVSPGLSPFLSTFMTLVYSSKVKAWQSVMLSLINLGRAIRKDFLGSGIKFGFQSVHNPT